MDGTDNCTVTVFSGNAEIVDRRLLRPAIPAIAGIGAGAIHAAAAGAHADHRLLANVFVAMAVAQLGTGIALLTQPGRAWARAVIIVNGAAVTGWVVTRVVGVWFVTGLEVAEPAEFADTVCASLGFLAALAAAFALRVDTRRGPTLNWEPAMTVRDLALPAIAVVLLTVPAMSVTATDAHAVDADDTHSHGISDDDAVDEAATVDSVVDAGRVDG